MVPKFWTGMPALPEEDYKIDCKDVNFDRMLIPDITQLTMSEPSNRMTVDTNCAEAENLKERMEDLWDRTGIVYLTNTGLTEPSSQKAIVSLLKPSCIVYEGGANKREHMIDNVYDTGAPMEASLHYHHEMAYIQESAQYVSFLCLQAPRHLENLRGVTFISENIGATRDLMNHSSGLFGKLKDKGLCYVRKLPDLKFFEDNPEKDRSIVYNYWQTSMLTNDPDEAVEVGQRMGLECEWQQSPYFGRYLVTKYYASCFEYDPFNDANVLFASMADDYHWFDSWPGVMGLPHWERPLKLNFGDDTVMTRYEKQIMTDVYDGHGIPIRWRKGDIAIICNYRTAHGRPAYHLEDGEQRELGVILGETFTRQGPLPGKWKAFPPPDSNETEIPNLTRQDMMDMVRFVTQPVV